MDQNVCNNFRIDGSSCSDIWSSEDASNLLLDIVNISRECSRENDIICVQQNIRQLEKEEKKIWECIDNFCGKNADTLVNLRKKALDDLKDSFIVFKETL